jgi:transposase
MPTEHPLWWRFRDNASCRIGCGCWPCRSPIAPSWSGGSGTGAPPARVVERARIVLLSADGLTGRQIAERVGASEPTVVLWRRRFAQDGLAGLDDRPRAGGPPTVLTERVREEILTATLSPPPAALGVTHWSSRLLADWLGRSGTTVSHDTISRLWRRFGIQPWRSEIFKFSTDPQLQAKVRDVLDEHGGDLLQHHHPAGHPPRHLHLS